MKLSQILFAFTIVAVVVSQSFAQEHTNRRDIMQDEVLRRDFNIQGEYIAKMDNFKVGLQLIARGDGKFSVVAYPGGLPGDGWKAGEPRMLGKAELDGDDIKFDMTEGKGTKDGQTIEMPENIKATGKVIIERPQPGQGQRPQGQGQGQGNRFAFRGFPVKIDVPLGDMNPALTFEKEFRQSPTLGEAAPSGAKVIFDGNNVDQFEPGAKINEVQFGNNNSSPRFNTLWADATTKPFENKPYKLHLEFMLSYMPEASGQGRSNSGVYLGQSYECQVLDSFGLEGENNECGGFYQISKPIVNMCFPPLVWQTYDIDYTPAKFEDGKKVSKAKISVTQNGVLIQDNVEFDHETGGGVAESDKPRGIHLQGHGNKVQYRNIWIEYK